MRITTKDLIKINELKRKYKLKGTTDEIINNYLTRCECCEEICFYDELRPIPNFKGDVYQCCEKCQKELLEENREQDWHFEDYMADVQHEQMMIENEGDYFKKC